MKDFPKSVLLVGGGNMGEALLSGWCNAGMHASSIHIIDASADRRDYLHSNYHIHTYGSSGDYLGNTPECIMFAIKPQHIGSVIKEYALRFSSSLYLSILAGTPLAFFEKHLANAPIIRIMPNTPALISQGVSVCIANDHATTAHKALCEHLMESVGSVHWLTDETDMDAVTALSGSGPAYVFYFIECLKNAAVNAGLDEALATTLSLQTITGATALALQSDDDVQILRHNVTSPAGTTAAAMEIFENEQIWASIIDDAIRAARDRAKELSTAL